MEQAIQKISELVSQLKSTQVQEQVTVDMSIVEEVNATSSIEQMNADIASLEAEIEFLDAEEVSEEEGDCGMLATNLFVFNQDGSASLEDMKRKRKRKRSSMEEMKRKREVLKRKRMLEDAVEVLKRKREVLKRKREVLKRKREVQKRGAKVIDYSTDVPVLDNIIDNVAVAVAVAVDETSDIEKKITSARAGAAEAIADAGLVKSKNYSKPTNLEAFYSAYKATLEDLHANKMINSRKGRDLEAAMVSKAAADGVVDFKQYLVTYQKDQLYKGQSNDRSNFVIEGNALITGIKSKHDERERANSKILKALA